MRNWLKGWTLSLTLMAVVFAACGETVPATCSPTDPTCGVGPGEETPDPLTVVQVSPADGAGNVDTGATVSISFSRPVSAASVTAASFTVGGVAGNHTVTGSTVTFVPSSPLDEGVAYAVSVNGIVDDAGVGLNSPFSSSFNTLSRPVSANAGPDMNVSVGSQITLDGGGSTGTGATFVWTQLTGPSVGALSGQSPAITLPADVALLSFALSVSAGTDTQVDTVHVWALEDGDHALWVSPAGSDGNPGTRDAPFQTIQAAINAADNVGQGADVYIAAGSYAETLTLRSRVSLYGGFDPVSWDRDIDANRPIVSGAAVAVRGVIANGLTVEGLSIIAANATGTGASSIAMLLDDSDEVRLRWNVFTAGNGANGSDGTAGSTGSKGSNGGNGTGATSLCVPGSPGGGGGSNYRSGGGGGAGGLFGGKNGGAGSGTYGGARGGGGATKKNGGTGSAPSRSGANGTAGAMGSGFGTVNSTGYGAAAGEDGVSGGGTGYGGGGGGGAGGTGTSCGGGGGGGGGGGRGGTVGEAGTGGGASVGVLLLGQTVAELIENEVSTGSGGVGGRGGSGGAGGGGGTRGTGGGKGCEWPLTSLCTGSGGNGANGSSGGRGGHGGGGGGGPSIGVVEAASATGTLNGNAFTLGTPGAGGASSGSSGSTGESVDHKKIT